MKKRLLIVSLFVFTVILIVSFFLLNRKEAPEPAQEPSQKVKEEVVERPVEEAVKKAPEQTAVYLEIIETNTDTFPKIVLRRKQYPRVYPFVYEKGRLFIDEKVLSMTEEGIEEVRINLRQKIDIKEGEEGKVYLVNFIKYTGRGRVYSREDFFAADSVPFTIKKPEWKQSEPKESQEEKGEENLLRMKGPASTEENELILSPSRSFYETFALRFWKSDIEVLKILKNGRVELRYAGEVFSLKAGEEKNLLGGEKTIRISEWLLDGTKFEHGEITFKTGLVIKNYGNVEVVNKKDENP